MVRNQQAVPPRVPDLAGARAVVVGAGVAGLCTALELRRAAADCLLIDNAPFGANASGVAAGMLAPAFESVLDPASRGRFELLRTGRDLWLELDVELHRDGALWLTEDGDPVELAAALRDAGAAAERIESAELRRLQPGLAPSIGPGVFTPDDWRLDPLPTLTRLNRRFAGLGGRVLTACVSAVTARRVQTDTSVLEADLVVVCGGFGGARLNNGAPELAALSPIRGELVRFPAADPRSGPALRHAGGYVVPSEGGPIAGATMEAGVDDLRPSAAQATQAAAAARVLPHLAGATYQGAVGVRAATPDGLPLVGRSSSGVLLAAGFRRNGWTLAPLAARMLATAAAGADPGPWAETLRPGRVLVA